MTPAVERLVRALRRLPGVGRKTAARYALALLAAGPERFLELEQALAEVRERVRPCPECFTWTEEVPCPICRERAGNPTVCVVETPTEVAAIERTGSYRGRYHVLGGVLDPLAGVSLADLTVDALLERVREGGITEVLLALSPTPEGQATARLLVTLLGETGVRVTQLAYGLPLGTRLEYLDEATLALALDHRHEVE